MLDAQKKSLLSRTFLFKSRIFWISLLLACLAWASYRGIESYRFTVEMAKAREDAGAGRYDAARVRLERLSGRGGRYRGDVQYLLGGVDAALGKIQEALRAWGRVPDDSDEAEDAFFDRARVALEHGVLSVAEESLERLKGLSGKHREDASRLADQLDLYLGDSKAIGRRIEERWNTSKDQATLLRTHWLLESQPYPVESVKRSLDKMMVEGSGDRLLGLAIANLNTKLGQFETADSWLKLFEDEYRGDEIRLRWAIAAGRPEAILSAASKIYAGDFDADEIQSIIATLSGLRGDLESERSALRNKVELDPGDAASWERLAELASQKSNIAEEAEARKHKAEIDQAKDRYRTLMGNLAAGTATDFRELATTAEILGRRFEARGWWSLLARQPGGNDEARLAFNRLAPAVKSRLIDLTFNPGPRLSLLFPKFDLPDKPKTEVAAGPSVPRFEEIAEKAGLRFTYDQDPTPLKRLPETMGGGIGLIDYDNDGFLDIYAVQGGKLVPNQGETLLNADKLFRNQGDGTFKDVTESAGLSRFPGGYGHGVTVGDYDNDGRSDLFITRWRSYALYHNKGDGTFDDATEKTGLGGPRGWPTSAAFGDLDNDGDLDLYVCQYLEWDPVKTAPCPDPSHPGHYAYCVPRALKSEPDRLYRNDGGVFKDVSKEAGIVDDDGRGLGVIMADLDLDGLLDIYVANDMSANFLFKNLGNLHFEEIGQISGTSSNGDGGFQAGMGVACGDLDGDGLPELAVTNFHGESTSLFQNLGQGLFADRTSTSGLGGPSRYVLGFGAAFLDANDDGKLDLATANGHVNDYRPAIPYAMPSQLYLNLGNGKLGEVSEKAGACWQELRVSRGLAIGDLDNDYRLDLVILSQGTPLALFHNLGVASNPKPHAATLKLVGKTTNRDGVGTKILIKARKVTQTIQRLGGGSFLSASDGRIHIGLGAAESFDAEVRWTNGKVDRFEGLKADASHEITEGEPKAKPSR